LNIFLAYHTTDLTGTVLGIFTIGILNKHPDMSTSCDRVIKIVKPTVVIWAVSVVPPQFVAKFKIGKEGFEIHLINKASKPVLIVHTVMVIKSVVHDLPNLLFSRLPFLLPEKHLC